ncbi:MAG: hypothetical protein WAN11_25420 [Syntrophobacteraceae bacterium]
MSGFYVLAGVAMAASLGCLALKPPKPVVATGRTDQRGNYSYDTIKGGSE